MQLRLQLQPNAEASPTDHSSGTDPDSQLLTSDDSWMIHRLAQILWSILKGRLCGPQQPMGIVALAMCLRAHFLRRRHC